MNNSFAEVSKRSATSRVTRTSRPRPISYMQSLKQGKEIAKRRSMKRNGRERSFIGSILEQTCTGLTSNGGQDYSRLQDYACFSPTMLNTVKQVSDKIKPYLSRPTPSVESPSSSRVPLLHPPQSRVQSPKTADTSSPTSNPNTATFKTPSCRPTPGNTFTPETPSPKPLDSRSQSSTSSRKGSLLGVDKAAKKLYSWSKSWSKNKIYGKTKSKDSSSESRESKGSSGKKSSDTISTSQVEQLENVREAVDNLSVGEITITARDADALRTEMIHSIEAVRPKTPHLSSAESDAQLHDASMTELIIPQATHMAQSMIDAKSPQSAGTDMSRNTSARNSKRLGLSYKSESVVDLLNPELAFQFMDNKLRPERPAANDPASKLIYSSHCEAAYEWYELNMEIQKLEERCKEAALESAHFRKWSTKGLLEDQQFREGQLKSLENDARILNQQIAEMEDIKARDCECISKTIEDSEQSRAQY